MTDPAESLFHRAADLPLQDRPAFLEAACHGNVVLRQEVESLLACDEQLRDSGSVFESPLVRPAVAQFPTDRRPSDGAAPPSDSDGVELPQQIGRFRVLRVLGEGGMGIVYEAEQDNPRRSVALKVIRPDLFSPEILRRFGREAQILGRLHSPGIAQIYEAGLADDGRPFIALEFIHGIPLQEYARCHLPGTEDRLHLFARVCDAVQHAHDHGIIHRDLKPSNILVDGTGQPKVLDFGVARSEGGEWQTAGGRTQTGQMIGTPQYMSPEQVGGLPQTLTIRSDVYSLGVILFELLSNRRPYQLDHLSLPEVSRVIREHEPFRRSARDSIFRGELGTIVEKAMEKDKSRRYASAGELATDIRRYLNDEPIRARPPSATYRMQKFVRRYKALVGGIVGVVVALLLGLIGVLGMYAQAQREADKARQARDFLVSILRISETDARGGSVPARQILADAELRIQAEFVNQPELRAELLDVIGDVQRGMARRAPRAMILHLSGAVQLRKADGTERSAARHELVYLNDRLTLSADAQLQLLFLADLHQERLRAGRQVTIDLAACRPDDAVLERDTSILMPFVRVSKGTFYRGWDGAKRKRGVATEINEDFEIA
ncbi:MAG: serine/threonine protein kinase, partial [Pirellulaceae bacterium]